MTSKLREALDNSQSLLAMINHLGAFGEMHGISSAIWTAEQLTKLTAEQIEANRGVLNSDAQETDLPGFAQAAQVHPVAWRWRPRGSITWIYDPEPEWLKENQNDPAIEYQPLFLAAQPPAAPVTATQGIEWFERTFGVPLGDKPGRADVERVRSGLPPAAPVETAESLREALLDPNVVHINMLSGGIAKPSWAQIKHLYLEQFPDAPVETKFVCPNCSNDLCKRDGCRVASPNSSAETRGQEG